MATVDRRFELDAILREFLGNNNTYFESPSSIKMKFPCVRYSRSHMDTVYANNKVYLNRKRYELILIYDDPDSELPEKLQNYLTVTHDRHYVADNLHHDVFTTYF